MKNLRQVIKISLFVTLLFQAGVCMATYSDPTAKTNENAVSPLFEQNISDYKGFEQTMERSKESGVKSVEANSGFNDLVGSKDAEAKASELSNIRADELEHAGIKESVKENWVNDYLLDYTKPGMSQYKKDAELIAEGTGKKLQELVQVLEKLGIDCKQVKGNKETEAQYFVDLKQEQQKDTVYNKQLCEILRNKYSCRDTRTVRCSHVENSSHLNIVGTNLPVIENRPGYARFGSHNAHWLRGGSGTSYDYHINFNIASPEGVQFFRIGSVNYDDFVLIKLNGHHVWSGPFGGDRLELVPQGWWKGVIIDSSGKPHSPENDTWFHANLNIEMKQHLHAGTNSLTVRVIVGGKGGVLFDLSMLERGCASWSETWDEVGKID